MAKTHSHIRSLGTIITGRRNIFCDLSTSVRRGISDDGVGQTIGSTSLVVVYVSHVRRHVDRLAARRTGHGSQPFTVTTAADGATIRHTVFQTLGNGGTCRDDNRSVTGCIDTSWSTITWFRGRGKYVDS